MPDLPSGTVTFLFTDIEGSTRLLQQQGQRYASLLTAYRELLRASFQTHGGQEVDTQGDSFFVAFRRAVDAVTAAVAIQRALAHHAWPEGVSMPTRMGLHTGEPQLQVGGYVGLDVHRAARLMAAGHGGQVLLSQATAGLVLHALPAGVRLGDLGEHRLKDLLHPERIFQLVIPDLPSDFPALKTLNSRLNNLPTQPTPLIGREREIANVAALLRRADVRLVTLTGPGGTGKTRLGLQVAAELLDDFADGVWFVNLAPLSDPDLVATAIAQTLGVQETGGRALIEGIKAYLREKQLLLLLDNFEQIVDAAPCIADLLAAAPGLKVLVTSREPLHLRGEKEFPVPALAVPDLQRRASLETLSLYAAVQLFIARAQDVKPDFAVTNANAPAVAEICHRLDGLPLALELAAARVKLFPPQALLTRLESRLTLLTGGARDLPARQQTIRSTIDWSYTLLSADEQRLFRRLGVFVGGFTLEAAEAVCGDQGSGIRDQGSGEASPTPDPRPLIPVLDGITALVDKSLVKQVEGHDGGPRFTMLETLREYALERLAASGEAEALRRQHAEYFVALAEAISAEGGEYEHWDARTRTEYANLLEVLVWCRTAEPGGSPEADLGMRLAKALRLYWFTNDLREGLRWLQELCGPEWRHGPAHLRARLLSSLGQYIYTSAHHDWWSQALAVLEEGVRLSREIGDMWALAEACRHRGEAAGSKEDLSEATAWFSESLTAARAASSPWNIAWTQCAFGMVAEMQGDDQEAARLFEECLPMFQRLGKGVNVVAGHYSVVLLRLGELDRAASLLDDALTSNRVELSLSEFADLHDYCGQVAYAQSDLGRAAHHLVQALRFGRESGQHFSPESSLAMRRRLLSEIAVVAAAQGQYVQATRWLSHASERFYLDKPNLVESQISQSLAACRAALGEEAFATAWAAGRAMTIEGAIAEALGEADRGSALSEQNQMATPTEGG